MVFIHPKPKPALKIAIAVLADAFGATADVSSNMPRRVGTTSFIVVERIGGNRPNLVTDSARLLIHCFATSPLLVEDMVATVDETFHNAVGTVVESVFIRDWNDITGPLNKPHPDVLTMERWQVSGYLELSTTTPS